jgi:pimeloyl-ACP methyl ester carboxylesterase
MPSFLHPDGTSTVYEVNGTGPALLMIHGAEGSRRAFDRVVPMLSRDFSVITYDQRDCGETSNPPTAATLEVLANDVKELLAGLGHESTFVFGTSFGGRVAQALSLLHPSVVSKLILASTWPLPSSLSALNERVPQEMARLRDELPASAERLAEIFFPVQFLEEQPQFRQHFAKAPARSERSRRRSQAVDDRPPLSAGDIRSKTLLMAGERDILVPPALTFSMSREIAGSESAELTGVGHLTCIQAPELVAGNLRRFLLGRSDHS